jgi:hypothetical protein
MRMNGKLGLLALITMFAATSVAAAEAGQPRLKFRGKALACTCANGMSEEDIRKAWEARFPQSQGAPLDRLDGRPQTRDEQKEVGR